MSDTSRRVLDWNDVAALSRALAAELVATRFDTLLAVSRGGLVPAAMLAQLLGMRDVSLASVASYEGEERGDALVFYHFPRPEDLAGRRVLVVDDVWDSGRTAVAVRDRVRAAGGRPTLAVLHFKPDSSVFPGQEPEHFVESTDAWIVYPWEALAPGREPGTAPEDRPQSPASSSRSET